MSTCGGQLTRQQERGGQRSARDEPLESTVRRAKECTPQKKRKRTRLAVCRWTLDLSSVSLSVLSCPPTTQRVHICARSASSATHFEPCVLVWRSCPPASLSSSRALEPSVLPTHHPTRLHQRPVNPPTHSADGRLRACGQPHGVRQRKKGRRAHGWAATRARRERTEGGRRKSEDKPDERSLPVPSPYICSSWRWRTTVSLSVRDRRRHVDSPPAWRPWTRGSEDGQSQSRARRARGASLARSGHRRHRRG
ncbi:hypothetical protein C8Q76DRAFT_230285 [Earliella scabrosa]|nr:hypothetical protein C8Q76DRAFT_230285 [Earliella scabrosa]